MSSVCIDILAKTAFVKNVMTREQNVRTRLQSAPSDFILIKKGNIAYIMEFSMRINTFVGKLATRMKNKN